MVRRPIRLQCLPLFVQRRGLHTACQIRARMGGSVFRIARAEVHGGSEASKPFQQGWQRSVAALPAPRLGLITPRVRQQQFQTLAFGHTSSRRGLHTPMAQLLLELPKAEGDTFVRKCTEAAATAAPPHGMADDFLSMASPPRAVELLSIFAKLGLSHPLAALLCGSQDTPTTLLSCVEGLSRLLHPQPDLLALFTKRLDAGVDSLGMKDLILGLCAAVRFKLPAYAETLQLRSPVLLKECLVGLEGLLGCIHTPSHVIHVALLLALLSVDEMHVIAAVLLSPQLAAALPSLPCSAICDFTQAAALCLFQLMGRGGVDETLQLQRQLLQCLDVSVQLLSRMQQRLSLRQRNILREILSRTVLVASEGDTRVALHHAGVREVYVDLGQQQHLFTGDLLEVLPGARLLQEAPPLIAAESFSLACIASHDLSGLYQHSLKVLPAISAQSRL
ncbi:hypothetical protein cyc_03496 [Cyclospora cayetanensis]|uniref:Uncharacterized protein n=1 Tax=Cyclospora cayetanensis TaxID=88456 RepID=A0A1D3CXQ7_9EIME|nr:hypothetical protein cyc_03496 [Cyclospora cayetanensis]